MELLFCGEHFNWHMIEGLIFYFSFKLQFRFCFALFARIPFCGSTFLRFPLADQRFSRLPYWLLTYRVSVRLRLGYVLRGLPLFTHPFSRFTYPFSRFTYPFSRFSYPSRRAPYPSHRVPNSSRRIQDPFCRVPSAISLYALYAKIPPDLGWDLSMNDDLNNPLIRWD